MTTMIEAGAVCGALLLGALLGACFFYGLWWTVRRAAGSARPALLFASSFVLRLGIVTGGFWLLSRTQPQLLLFAAAGFLVARLAAVRIARNARMTPPGAPHAS